MDHLESYLCQHPDTTDIDDPYVYSDDCVYVDTTNLGDESTCPSGMYAVGFSRGDPYQGSENDFRRIDSMLCCTPNFFCEVPE